MRGRLGVAGEAGMKPGYRRTPVWAELANHTKTGEWSNRWWVARSTDVTDAPVYTFILRKMTGVCQRDLAQLPVIYGFS